MRTVCLVPANLLLSIATAFQLADFQPFVQALPNTLQDLLPESLHNETAHELLKRQHSNTCPKDFNSCANLGASNLCCHSRAVCSADYAGHVACCPSGAACTGTIGGIITAGTLNSNGGIVGGGGAVATGTTAGSGGVATNSAQTTTTTFQFATSTSNGLVMATTHSTVGSGDGGVAGGVGFIVDGTSTVATPGAGIRRAEIPFVVLVVVQILELLPI